MKYNFTICLGPLFNNFSKESVLLEFIEMHRILGVEKIAIYVFEISIQISNILKIYEQLNIVDVYPWKPNVDVFYQGQLGMLNDCLYRYMYSTKYIAFLDTDEMIIPKDVNTWTEMFYYLEKKGTRKKCLWIYFSMCNI